MRNVLTQDAHSVFNRKLVFTRRVRAHVLKQRFIMSIEVCIPPQPELLLNAT
jgi:hypothetical protein